MHFFSKVRLPIKQISLVVFMFNCLFANAQITFPVNGPQDIKPECFAFTNATIFIDSKTKFQNATLVIKDGKVVSAGAKIVIPSDAKIINLNGKVIYPSFIDLFSNYGLPPEQKMRQRQNQRRQQFISTKKGAYSWNEAVKPEINASEVFASDENASENYLKSGFSYVLTGSQDGICRGTSALVMLGGEEENNLIVNPAAATGFSFDKGSSTQDYPSSLMGSIALLRQTFLDAAWYKNQNKEKNLSLEALNQSMNLPKIFEVDNKLSLLRAAKIASEFKLNFIIKGAGDEYQRLNEIKETKAALVVPINFPKPFEVEDAFDAQYVSLADLKHWEMAPANLKFLADASIDFSITKQNCSNNEEFLKNIRKAVKYGLSEEKALAALTEIPARFIGAKEIGTLKTGMIASFIICSKNIFDDGSLVLENWVGGKQNVLNDEAEIDIRGNYLVKMNGYENYKLNIDGEQSKPQLIFYRTDTFKVDFSQQFGLLNFSFKPNKKTEEIIRISAWIEEFGKDSFPKVPLHIKGRAQMPDAQIIDFEASFEQAVKIKSKKDSTPEISYGQVIYPFSDYGNVNLPQTETIIFKNATVWTNENEGILKESDVVISNGKIIAVGKNLELKNAKIIDAKGLHLSSGIIDEHSHIGIFRGVNEGTQAVTSEVRIGDVVNGDDVNIYRQLAGGVVASQLLHGSANPIGGQSAIIKLRWGQASEKMKIEGADGFIKFALGENVKQSNWGDNSVTRYPQTRMGVEQVLYDAFIRAREYEKKLRENPKYTRRDLELDALIEILQKKRFITCHSYVQSEINMLMHVADSFGFKVNTFTHILEGYKVADKMKKHGANASTFADWWAYKYEVIDAIPYNAALMHYEGLNVAINSDDAEMGRRLNQEAAKAVKYGGVSEEEAWKMVTLNPAKMLHLDAKMGSIKAGKDADIVLWSDNPLSIYAKPLMTFVDGICYFSVERDEQNRKLMNSERQRIIAKMIAAKKKGEKAVKKVSEQDEVYHCED